MPAIHRWTLASLDRVRNERHMYISAHDDRLLLHLIPNYFNRTKSIFGMVSKHTCAVRSANEFRVVTKCFRKQCENPYHIVSWRDFA